MLTESKAIITKNKYEELQKQGALAISRYAEKTAEKSMFKPAGYGIYGSRLLRDNNRKEYYIAWLHDVSCD